MTQTNLHNLIQELKFGRSIYITDADGTETVSRRPPTSLDLRAARAIENLVSILNTSDAQIKTLNKMLEHRDADYTELKAKYDELAAKQN